MTDQIMIQLAKLQTENRNLKQDIKKSTQLLLKRNRIFFTEIIC